MKRRGRETSRKCECLRSRMGILEIAENVDDCDHLWKFLMKHDIRRTGRDGERKVQ